MDKPHFAIRLADQSDLPAMHWVRKAAFAHIYTSFRSSLSKRTAESIFANAEHDQGAYLDKVAVPDRNRGILVAIVDEEVVGFCAYVLDTKRSVGTIDLNAVHPDHASRGIGSALYERALSIMKLEGMHAAQVSTGGDSSHAPARRAYEKVGLTESIPSVLLCRAL